MKIFASVTCERCGEGHGTIEIGPEKLKGLRSPKKMAELVTGLLPMFLRQGIEHECAMTDARRAEIREYVLKDRCPVCGARVSADPKDATRVCDSCSWKCTAEALAAVRGF